MRKKEEAVEYFKKGYEPVECAFGDGSVVGNFVMAHHNEYSHLPSVTLHAWQIRGQHGPILRFVTTGGADADATMAMLLLSGEPINIFLDLGKLIGLIDRMDTDPIGFDLLDQGDEGAALLLWNQMAPLIQDAVVFYGGIDRWRWILSASREDLVPYLKIARQIELQRLMKAQDTQMVEISPQVAIALPRGRFFGFDVWYREYLVVIQLNRQGIATIGCPNKEIAERLFGPGGLKNVFSKLEPAGWGGRENVGGSPRGQTVSIDEVVAAAAIVAAAVRKGV